MCNKIDLRIKVKHKSCFTLKLKSALLQESMKLTTSMKYLYYINVYKYKQLSKLKSGATRCHYTGTTNERNVIDSDSYRPAKRKRNSTGTIAVCLFLSHYVNVIVAGQLRLERHWFKLKVYYNFYAVFHSVEANVVEKITMLHFVSQIDFVSLWFIFFHVAV